MAKETQMPCWYVPTLVICGAGEADGDGVGVRDPEAVGDGEGDGDADEGVVTGDGLALPGEVTVCTTGMMAGRGAGPEGRGAAGCVAEITGGGGSVAAGPGHGHGESRRG